MKTSKAKARKHSEVWYAVKLPSNKFAVDLCEWANTTGLILAPKKEHLSGFNNNRQKIVKVRITEI